MMLLKLMALVTAVVHMVSAQDIGGNVLAQGESGNTQSVIVTTKTRAFLSCESGDMVVKVNFSDPFRGLMYAHKSRTSPCRIHGTGATYYELRIPLKGCGTWQESPRVFVNNVTIRFHPALELEEDETKTIVCRYPPPLTQPPGSVQVIEPPTRISPTPIPTRVSTAKLSEVEILIIICLLLFLSLLTLGIGIAYFCLKRRNIRLVRKSVPASSPGSQLTRLSSSRLAASSSVLGTTVRIPRAVPYSAAVDHHYEDYRGGESSAAATETTSGEEATSSSSASVEETEGVYRKLGPKSLLSIPKAILRKPTPAHRWHQPQAVHHHQTTAVKKRLETEDQTVSAVLGAEEVYWALKDGDDTHRVTSANGSSPVYAQVDKNRKSAPAKRPGSAQRQVTSLPEERRTSEEVVHTDTTVTTSVRKEVTETRIVSPALDRFRRELEGKEEAQGLDKGDSSSLVPVDPPPKTVLIRDVSDVFVTTTVETELRELTTTHSRDSVEAHRATKAIPAAAEEEKAPNWSVVIRQKEPLERVEEPPTEEGVAEEGEVKPQFDVKIRTRPPSVEQPKTPDPLVVIPPLEMPKTLSMLREALKPKKPLEGGARGGGEEEKAPQRTVRWREDTKEGASKDTVSSSDSYQSAAESLRERSSSEVLEVAPTLPSQQRRPSNRPMLERSTSEMVPEDHVRWVGGQVPVLESLSPEFLANIPVVIQGGFFNKQRSPTPHENPDL